MIQQKFHCAQQKNSNFQNFGWMIRMQPISLLKLFLLYEKKRMNLQNVFHHIVTVCRLEDYFFFDGLVKFYEPYSLRMFPAITKRWISLVPVEINKIQNDILLQKLFQNWDSDNSEQFLEQNTFFETCYLRLLLTYRIIYWNN